LRPYHTTADPACSKMTPPARHALTTHPLFTAFQLRLNSSLFLVYW